MRDGAEVIYQGVFVDAPWRGIADFLIRVERPSRLGAWSYEACGREARAPSQAVLHPAALLVQRAARTAAGRAAGAHARRARHRRDGVVRPARLSARTTARVRARFMRALAERRETYPSPVGHCHVCGYASHCEAAARGGRSPEPGGGDAARPGGAAERRAGHDGGAAGPSGSGDVDRHHAADARAAGAAGAAAGGGAHRRAPLRAAGAGAEARVRPAAGAVAGRHVLRHRGLPVLRDVPRPRVSLGRDDRRRRRLALPLVRVRGPRRREARVRGVHRLRLRPPRRRIPTCTSITTPPTRRARSSG